MSRSSVTSEHCRRLRGSDSRTSSGAGRRRPVAEADPQPLTDEAAAAIVASLHEHRVRFVVIGGFAVQLHQVDEFARTSDIDITPERSRANLERLAAALTELDARLVLALVPRYTAPRPHREERHPRRVARCALGQMCNWRRRRPRRRRSSSACQRGRRRRPAMPPSTASAVPVVAPADGAGEVQDRGGDLVGGDEAARSAGALRGRRARRRGPAPGRAAARSTACRSCRGSRS